MSVHVHGAVRCAHRTLRAIVIIDQQDHVFTTSLLVAEKFEKQHKNVLRDIEAIINKCPVPDFSRLNFEPSDYQNERGKTYPMYKMTRKGFTMLASWKPRRVRTAHHLRVSE